MPSLLKSLIGKTVLLGNYYNPQGAPEIGLAGDVDFGSTPDGTPVSEIYTITNTGSSDLIITAINVPTGYTLTDPALPITIEPGNNDTFTIRADADTAGTFAGDVTIVSNIDDYVFAITVTITINFLMRDDFTTDDAAPITAPRTSEPGPGTWAVTDSGNKLSISSGALQIASGTGAGDPALHGAGLARAAGLAIAGTFTPATNAAFARFGFDSNQVGDAPYVILFNNVGEIRVQDNALVYPAVGTYTATAYSFAVICRNAGIMVFIKGGTFTNWTLLMVTPSLSLTPVYPALTFTTFSGASSVALARAAQLEAALIDPLIAIAAPAGNTGSIAPGVEVAITADFVLEVSITAEPSSGNNDFHFRVQDANNYWQRRITATGAIDLNEVVAGVATLRGSSAAAFAAGETLAMSVRNETIRIYANSVSKISYASASNFKTATGWTYAAIGTSGDEDNLKIWQGNYPTGDLADRLDEMVTP